MRAYAALHLLAMYLALVAALPGLALESRLPHAARHALKLLGLWRPAPRAAMLPVLVSMLLVRSHMWSHRCPLKPSCCHAAAGKHAQFVLQLQASRLLVRGFLVATCRLTPTAAHTSAHRELRASLRQEELTCFKLTIPREGRF